MIPAFNEYGYLPPGVYPATIDEVAARFGQQSELRGVQVESLRWMIDLARRAGVERIVLNGSFVTDEPEPNDVDCVLLVAPDFPRGRTAEVELQRGLPFLQIDLAVQDEFDVMINRFFATDRAQVPKGMIEVVRWN